MKRMKKKGKRILALLTAILLMAGVLPQAAFAGGDSPTVTVAPAIFNVSAEGSQEYAEVTSSADGTVYVVPKAAADYANAADLQTAQLFRMQREATVPEACYVGGMSAGQYQVYAVDGSGNVSAPAALTVKPVLTAAANTGRNYVELSWVSNSSSDHYMIYQKDADGNDVYQTIPAKSNIKVLNVYPDISFSDTLKGWMETPVPGEEYKVGSPVVDGVQYTMGVDKVRLSDFNGHADDYLKDSAGNYKYDAVYFGASDANNGMDLGFPNYDDFPWMPGYGQEDATLSAVKSFLNYGGGVLMGHDTAMGAHPNFRTIAMEYLNMDVANGTEYGDSYPGNVVVVNKRGLLSNFPYSLGDIGAQLHTPSSHSYRQLAMGDVWFKYFPQWPENTGNGRGTNNFYLTTWNNCAMVQTGHSANAEPATLDEQKIIVNTLYYLSQITTNNEAADHMSQDFAAPDAVDASTLAADSSYVSWAAPSDNGSSYTYKLKEVSPDGNSVVESDETSATVTTGIDHYVVLIDNNSTAAASAVKSTGSIEENPSADISMLEVETGYYIHIIAVDKAGNESSVATASFTTPPDSAVQPVISTQPVDRTVAAGSTAEFSIAISYPITGNSYQWQKDMNGEWMNIDDATSAALSVSNVTSADDGTRYRCVVTNTVGETHESIVSDAASLHVAYTATVNTCIDGTGANAPGVVELWQGGGKKATAESGGGTAGVYTVSVLNGTYDIYINGEDTGKDVVISGAAAAGETVNYYTVNYSVADSGLASGSTIAAAVGEAEHTSGGTVLAGKTVTITVTGAGEGANSYTYLWSGDGTGGQTANTLTLVVNDTVDALCTVTGSASYAIILNANGGTINSGNISTYNYGTPVALPTDVTKGNAVFAGWYANAELNGQRITQITAANTGDKVFYAKWVNAPVISAQPANASVAAGGTAEFAVAVSSPGEGGTYQWQKYIDGVWMNIGGATSPTLSISNTSAADDGSRYRCVVTNTEDSVEASAISGEAALSVTYTATVITRLNDSAAAAPGAVELRQNGSTKATAVSSVNAVYTASVLNGTYNIYINGEDTGKTVTVNGAAAAADTVNYYTVSFNFAQSGPASGSTIGAHIGGTPFASGAKVLAGKQVILTATGAGASSYTYLWSGAGTSGKTAEELGANELILTVNSAADVLCAITGSSAYTVTLNANGGTINSGNVNTYTYGTPVMLPREVSLANATFAGWYANEDFSGEPVTQITASDMGARTFYAKWTNTVTFSNNYAGAPVFATKTDAIHNAAMSFDQTPTRTGYTFAGWYKDTACLDPWSFSSDTVSRNLPLYARWITTAYSITGKVVDDTTPTPNNVSGAAVKLMQGNTQFGGTVTTDENGNFNLNGVPNGTYNLVVSKDGKTVTVCVTVKNGSYDFGNTYIVLPAGNKSSIVDVKGNDTPSVVVDGLNSQFTPEDAADVSNGKTIKVTLEVENKGTAAPGANDLQTAASGKTIDMYLEMTVFHQVDTDARTTLDTVPNLLKIIIPYDLSCKSNVTVYRYHGAAAQAMTQLAYSTATPAGEGYMLNTADSQIIIWAKNFSTYAVAYSTGDGSGNTNPPGGASAVTSYNITVPTSIVGGSISPNGTVNVAKGGSKTFTITPDKGYIISDVLVDAKSMGAVSSYTFSNITEAHTISVVFTKSGNVSGLPYYYNDSGKKVFVGFASDASGSMKYIAPEGKTVLFEENPKDFKDIKSHWGKAYIDFVTERETFVGTGDRIFSPDAGMTRAMLATVIGRLYERSYGPLGTKGVHAFTDCNYSSWYGSYIDWCSEKGIIQGIGGSKFQPDRQVTRQEMVVMLYRFAEFMKVSSDIKAGGTLSYSDASQIPTWAQAAALYCQQTGIITGRNGNSFAPKETATRAEVAVIFKRFIEIVLK